MKADGMTLREIAAAEGTTVNAVMESLEAAKKKNQKTFLKITCTKQPVFLRIVKDLTSSERSKNAMNKFLKGGRPNETHHHLGLLFFE